MQLVASCFLIVLALIQVECFILGSGSGESCRRNSTNETVSDDCKDSSEISCESADKLFFVCCDVQHAKSTCRRFCNLCDLVDGNWSEWSEWSTCDVSCGDGNLTRQRTCSNPAPAEGGLNCTGSSTEHQNCSMDPCPVDGSWSSWGSWGKCSVTCGVGIQRRDRNCSDPAPLYYGDHCFGDSHEDDICYSDHCSDGSWSAWTSWGSCSKTCGRGIRSRERYCNNPAPSLLGSDCQGHSSESDICGRDPFYEIFHENESCCVKFKGRDGNAYQLCDGDGRNFCNPRQGRVEVNTLGWKTFCNDGWNVTTASVVCRSLGYCSGKPIRTVAGRGSIYLLSEFTCSGNESSIFNCHHTESKPSGCTHNHDATIMCE